MARSGWLGAGGLWLLLLLTLSVAGAQERMVGAPRQVSLESNAEAQRALHFAMGLYNQGSNGVFLSRVDQVVSVQKQIVAGVKYIFTVQVKQTGCRKTETALEHCAFLESDQRPATTCTFEVLVVPWRNETKLLKNQCH